MFGDDDMVEETTNLQEEDTGIPGVIFVSTAMGFHGPRVNYFIKAGRAQPSLSASIPPDPQVLANSLPLREFNRAAPSVIAWVRLNAEALLRFWNEGETYSVRNVVTFAQALRKNSDPPASDWPRSSFLFRREHAEDADQRDGGEAQDQLRDGVRVQGGERVGRTAQARERDGID